MTQPTNDPGSLEHHLTLQEVGDPDGDGTYRTLAEVGDRTPDTTGTSVMAGWVTLDEAGGMWEDADLLETSTLTTVLNAAYEDAVEYLRGLDGYTDPRELDPPQPIPHRWKVAQIMLARHVWARMRTGNRDDIGPDGMVVSTYPIVLEARAQLRPKTSPFRGIL